MKTLLQYHNHTPEKSDGFYHAECPQLYAMHDTITTLAECPFPLVTDSFRVIHFGTSISQPDDAAKGYGHTKRFAVVEYVKACGHLSRERISFSEGVTDFESYGTHFTGASYSINDWKNRIERFRNADCDVCSMIRHQVWCWVESISERPKSKARALKDCLFLLDANYSNWREIVPQSEVETRFLALKRAA